MGYIEYMGYDESYLHPEDMVVIEEPECNGKSRQLCVSCGKCLSIFATCGCSAATGFNVNTSQQPNLNVEDLYNEIGKMSWNKNSEWNKAIAAVREYIRGSIR